MKKRNFFVLPLSLLFSGVCVFAGGEAAPIREKTKTQIEAFSSEVGVVYIKRFFKGRTITGNYGAEVSLTAQEVVNAGTGKSNSGIAIDVKSGGRYEREDRSFIDYDEIDSLVKGMDYIINAKPDLSLFGNYEAVYATRGDFKITVFSNEKSGSVSIAVNSGSLTTAFFEKNKFLDLKYSIVQAKQKLDDLKKGK